jgi:hypothetical protein
MLGYFQERIDMLKELTAYESEPVFDDSWSEGGRPTIGKRSSTGSSAAANGVCYSSRRSGRTCHCRARSDSADMPN